jgi:DNA polymerase III alpha subunit
MHNDIYGNLILSENDLFDLYMQDPTRKIGTVFTDQDINFDEILEIENLPKIVKYTKSNLSIEEYDNLNQNTWLMPKEYIELDIAKWVLEQCQDQAELQRAGEELLLYQERDMFMLLRYLKYLVDTMREYNIVWGVGRGSSVASFVLFLIGVHKINSLYWGIPINEFLK